MGLPVSSCPDFRGQACPSRVVKFSTHLHPTAAPKPQETQTKWGWCCQRAAGLVHHQSKAQHDAGPGWQRPCPITSPTAAFHLRDLPTAGGTQEWRCSRSTARGRESHLPSPGRELRSHQGLQGGFPTTSLLPLGSLGLWAGGCCWFGFDHWMARLG